MRKLEGFIQHHFCSTTFNHSTKSGAGFTLIEVVIYIALFTIIVGGSFVTAYSVIESIGRNQTKAIIQEEGDFLIGKINWVFSGAQSVTSPAIITPATSASGPTLSLAKWDALIGNPIVITLSGTDIVISRGPNPAQPLNNSNIEVNSLNFEHASASGDGTTPESVRSSFTLDSRTPTGEVISQDFSTTNYLRK